MTDNAHVNGGSGKVAIQSAVGLAKRGVSVTLFTAKGPVDESLRNVDGLRIVCLGQYDILEHPNRMRAMSQGIWNVAARREMLAELRDFDGRRDIVHVHSWTKALSSSVLSAVVHRRANVVLTLHDYFTICPLGSVFNHRRREICTLAPMSGACVKENCDPRNYAQKLWRVGRQAVQRLVSDVPGGVDSFITISDFSAAVLRPHVGAGGARFYHVDNPIETESGAAGTPEASKTFVFTGRLSREKGAELFAQAARLADVDALFVGDGDCRADVERANPDAIFTGWLPAAQTREAVSQARALVFPSLWYENSPLAVPEAASLGIPAIVPDTSAARDQVVDGETGLIFRSGDVDDLAAKIARLRDDDAFVARLGRNAYRRFWTLPPTLDRHLDELSEVYADILKRRLEAAV